MQKQGSALGPPSKLSQFLLIKLRKRRRRVARQLGPALERGAQNRLHHFVRSLPARRGDLLDRLDALPHLVAERALSETQQCVQPAIVRISLPLEQQKPQARSLRMALRPLPASLKQALEVLQLAGSVIDDYKRIGRWIPICETIIPKPLLKGLGIEKAGIPTSLFLLHRHLKGKPGLPYAARAGERLPAKSRRMVTERSQRLKLRLSAHEADKGVVRPEQAAQGRSGERLRPVDVKRQPLGPCPRHPTCGFADLLASGLLCLCFPLSQQVHGEVRRVVVDELGTILAEPDGVVRVASFFRRKIGVVPGAARGRGGDVGGHADVKGLRRVDLRAAGKCAAIRVRTPVANARGHNPLDVLGEVVSRRHCVSIRLSELVV